MGIQTWEENRQASSMGADCWVYWWWIAPMTYRGSSWTWGYWKLSARNLMSRRNDWI